MSASTSSLTQSAPGLLQALEQLAAQPGGAQGVLGREAAGRVGQDRVPPGSRIVEQVPALAVEEPLAADRDGDHLGAAGSRQSRISSSVAYLPVPTNSRLRNACVPIFRGSTSAACEARPAADQGDDLQDVARGDRASRRGGTA